MIWDTVNNVGLRANYIASVYAARIMVKRGSGIIVNMSSPGGLTYLFNTAYGVGKAAQDRMAADFNHELKGTGVHALSIWPGAVKTELIQVLRVQQKLEINLCLRNIFWMEKNQLMNVNDDQSKFLATHSLLTGLGEQLHIYYLTMIFNLKLVV